MLIVFFQTIVNDTHRSQLAATVDILAHRTASDADAGVTTHKAGPLHGRISVVCCLIVPVYLNGGQVCMVVTSVAAAVDTTVDLDAA